MKRFLQTISSLALIAGASAVAQDQVELELEYPPPLLTGTAVAVDLPHLEPLNAAPPRILVPADVENAAFGKPVDASDDFPIIGDLFYITDGDKESEEGYYVELMEGLQWVQIDLEEEHTIYAVAVWHFHTQRRAYHDVVVQLSNDPEFEEGVVTLFNNDHDNSSGFGRGEDAAYLETNQGKLIPAGKTKARYVRLYSNGNTSNDMNHYCEVEVFGRPS